LENLWIIALGCIVLAVFYFKVLNRKVKIMGRFDLRLGLYQDRTAFQTKGRGTLDFFSILVPYDVSDMELSVYADGDPAWHRNIKDMLKTTPRGWRRQDQSAGVLLREFPDVKFSEGVALKVKNKSFTDAYVSGDYAYSLRKGLFS